MKKQIIKLISMLLVAVMMLSALVSCGGKDDEEKGKVLNATEYLEKIFEKTFPTQNAPTYNSVSSEVIFTPSPDMGLGIDKVTSKAYLNNSGESVVFVSAELMEEKIDLSLYSGGTSVVANSNVLGDTNYGMSLEQLEEFLTSMLQGAVPVDEDDYYDDDDYYYDDDDYLGDVVAPSTPDYSAVIEVLMGILENNGAAIGATAEKYLDVIVKSAENAIESTAKAEDDAVKVTFKFNSDSIKKIIKDVFNKAKADKDLRKLFSDVLKATGLDDEMLGEALGDYDEFFANEEILNGLFEAINEFPFGLTLSVTADKDYNAKNISFNFDFEADGAKQRLAIVWDIKNQANWTIEIKGQTMVEGSYKTMMSVKYALETVDTADGFKTTVKLSASEGNETIDALVYTVEYNKKAETYKISFKVGEALAEEAVEASVEGTLKIKDKTENLTIDKITIGNQSAKLDIKINTVYDDKLPAFPTEYKNILELTEEDINEILEKVEGHPVLGQLAEQFMPSDTDKNFREY